MGGVARLRWGCACALRMRLSACVAGALVELWSLLRTQVVARLVDDGWEVADPAWPAGVEIVELVHPVRDGFVASARLSAGYSTGSDQSPTLHPGLRVGIGFEPLIAIWPLLGAFGTSVLDERVADPADREGEAEHEASAGVEHATGSAEWVSSLADVTPPAERLARLVRDRAIAFAEPLASIESLLEGLRARSDEPPGLGLAALLAVTGRFDAAREELANCRWAPPHPTPPLLRPHAGPRLPAHRLLIGPPSSGWAATTVRQLPAAARA